jgi:pyruvate-formate lyase-activating enzyme
MPDVPVYPNCNMGCIFCSNPVSGFRGTQGRYSYRNFLKKWRSFLAGKKGVFRKFGEARDFVSLTGGEPTLHPDFIKIPAVIRKSLPDGRIKLLSNARLFRHESFTRLVLQVAGAPFEVAVPMFGHDVKSHEAISRAPGSFADTCAGLDRLFACRGPGQSVECRVILTRAQMSRLHRLLPFLRRRFPELASLDLLFVEMEGFAEKYDAQVRLSMTECARQLEREYGALKKFRQFKLLHFPLCVVPRRLWPFVWNTLDPRKVTWAPDCARCKVRRDCVGIGTGYAQRIGMEEFKAILKAPLTRSGNWYHPFGFGER